MKHFFGLLGTTAILAVALLLSTDSAQAAACATPNTCVSDLSCTGANVMIGDCASASQVCCKPSTSGTPTGTSGVSCSGSTVGGVCFPTGTGLAGEATGSLTIAGLFVNILQWLLAIFGVLAIIMFVVMGYKYLFAGVDEEQAEQAKAGVTYAVIGIIIALSGYIIVSFLGEIFTV